MTQLCGAWGAVNTAPARVATFTECPGLVVRNVGGSFSTTPGQEGRWEFFAPAGAVIDRVSYSGFLQGTSGWQGTLLTNTGAVIETCPGPRCPGGSKSLAYTNFGPVNAPGIYLRLRCGASSCPNNQGVKGYADLRWISMTIFDGTVPGVAITGGNLLSGWRRGVGSVSLDATDNVGIRTDQVRVDGTVRGSAPRPCADGLKYPCPNGPASLTLDTSLVPDGARTLRVESIDAAQNVGGQERRILVDNTPPTAPINLAQEGGEIWRSTNAFPLAWQNPRQAHAPIAGIEYELCPATNAPSNRKGCARGRRSGTSLARVSNVQVPRAGDWRARIWLRDAAGNHDAKSAVATALRFDPSPPSGVFLEQDADDPTLLRLDASDTVSGVARAEIEMRRRGEDIWRSLKVRRTSYGFAANANDEVLRKGLYEVRGRVFDQAGNERSTASRTNGRPALMKLPVRARSTIAVGRAGRLRCHDRGRSRRCARRLAAKPAVRFGRSTRLVGRLRAGGRPLRGVPVRVSSRLDLPGTRWRRIAVVRSSRSGHVRFRAPRGPARLLRFRYPGTAKLRGANAVVRLRVQAATSMRVSRRDVVNGEYVTFRGRVRSRPLPPSGKLVELQVFTRRRWRTFAQPRADARTGRWSFRYRFEAIRGDSRFRFRARVRREADYPYHTGSSRSVRVRVRGL